MTYSSTFTTQVRGFVSQPLTNLTSDLSPGLGMSGAVLLILMFYILGLFYGMCGSTPSEVRKQV